MRVTNKQLLNIVTRNVATSSEQLLKAQERVATMKRINRPSDDPIGMSKLLDYRKRIASIDQYTRNITSAEIQVEATVTGLEDVHELLNDAKDIAITQFSADDPSGRETAAREVIGIYDRIRDIANTRLGGTYIFAGHKTDTIPFTTDASYQTTYHGDDGEINAIVGEGMSFKINAHGNEAFTGVGVTDGVNIFDVLKDLKDALEAPVYNPTDIENQVGELIKGINQIENVTSQQSVAYKRLEHTEEYWNNLKQKFENVLSKTEDADAAQVAVELQAQETAYEMSLAAASNVLEKNILDFLA